jgi:hypothetical protein
MPGPAPFGRRFWEADVMSNMQPQSAPRAGRGWLRAALQGVAAAMGMAAALAATTAAAGVVYESAQYTGADTGEYILNQYNVMGAEFTITQKTAVTGIGGQFGGYPSDDIFGAILPVDAATGMPPGTSDNLDAIDLAHVLFSVPTAVAVDVTAPISVTLTPGTYAVVFGTNQFGATGWAGMGYQNDPVGSPTLIRSFFSTSFDPFYDTGVRFVVYGDVVATDAVPEPATWAMLLAGFGLIGGLLRSRRRTSLQAA